MVRDGEKGWMRGKEKKIDNKPHYRGETVDIVLFGLNSILLIMTLSGQGDYAFVSWKEFLIEYSGQGKL
jgi:hypothetical protein